MSEVGRTRSSPTTDEAEHNEAKDAPQAKSKWRSVGVVVGEDRSGFGPGGGRSGWTVDACGMSRIQMCALSGCTCDKYGFEYDSAQISRGDFYAPHLPPVDSVHGAFAVTDAGHDPVSLSSGGTRPQCNVLSHGSDSLNEPNCAVGPRSKNRRANTLCMIRQHEGEVYENSLSLSLFCMSADLVQYVTMIL